ncbi:copper homeostasis protein CutC [Motilimonas eburnea]|uniref:copper homeostasis protein CutC n=1 Tax=Motilimonas eburnea TaxID=1737488 RepID=UPI001E408C39|nr:copper homeostasis protein CutC [Motilimonas eburnea]MCE2573381.1 copper homeostasis protein CutC [Motilimonas eburnea]
MKVEVCIDNFESLQIAERAGADRIELCAALALGGISPNAGFIEQAVNYASIPIYVMIRPRSGDFYYSENEVEIMLKDIYHARVAGAQGVVFGVLDKQANVDRQVLKALMREAGQMGVTFHRAIDLASDYQSALETIIEAGCERVLTSGQACNALSGSGVISQMVKQAAGRLSVMAGAGVNHHNVADIVKQTGVTEVHLSGKSSRPSQMLLSPNAASMGDMDDFSLAITGEANIQSLRQALGLVING